MIVLKPFCNDHKLNNSYKLSVIYMYNIYNILYIIYIIILYNILYFYNIYRFVYYITYVELSTLSGLQVSKRSTNRQLL